MIRTLIRTIWLYSKNNRVVAVFLLSLFYCITLYMNPDDVKAGLLISLIYMAGFYVVTGGFFSALLFTFALSVFFLFPAKTYEFLYAFAREYVYETIPDGIFENITFAVSDALGILLVLYYVRERLHQQGRRGKKIFISMMNSPTVTTILVSWFIYFAFSLFSSLYYSAFPAFSVNVLAQYGKMVVLFLGTVYLHYKEPNRANLLYAVLLGLLLFQGGLGSMQFMQNLTSFGTIKQLQNLDTEQSTIFSRVDIGGISMHANNHAFSIAVLLLLTLPFVLHNLKKPWWIISIIAGINIILTQSRTIWICLLAALAYLHFVRALHVSALYKLFSVRTWIALIFALIAGMLFIVVPRIQLTNLFFTQDGGGTLRLKMLSEGWQILQQAPLTGFGVGTNVRVFLDLIPNGYIYTFPANPHIAYLQLALESGVPAALSFIFPIILILITAHFYRSRSQLRNRVRLSIVCCIIVVLLFFLVQPIYGRREYMYLALIIGIAVAELKQKISQHNA